MISKTKRLLNFSARCLAANFTDPVCSIKLNYVLTYHCNAKCLMCNIWRKPPMPELSIADIDNFFQHSNKFSWIDLSGGEIFLRPDLPMVIDSIADNCKNLFLFHYATNGFLTDTITRITEQVIRKNIPKTLVTVSIDADGILHDKIRGMAHAYENAIKTFKSLRKFNNRSFKVFVGMTITKYNMGQIENSLEQISKDLGGLADDEIHINIANSSGHYYANVQDNPCVDDAQTLQAVSYIQMKRKKIPFSPVSFLEDRYLKNVPTYLKTGKCPLPCRSLAVSCFMDPCGSIYPCNTYDAPIGNIKDFNFDLSALLKTDKARQILSNIKNNQCPQCWTPCEAYQTIITNIFKPQK